MMERENWSLTFSLNDSEGGCLGRFILYRKDTGSPLWMDLELFTTTGFSRAIASSMERIHMHWTTKIQKERRRVRTFDDSSRGLRPSVQDPLVAPSSS